MKILTYKRCNLILASCMNIIILSQEYRQIFLNYYILKKLSQHICKILIVFLILVT